VRSSEYEDWPRGRIVFDRSRQLYILYADRKLLTPAMLARIETQFSFAGGTHRDPKRRALPEHRDAERVRYKIHAALRVESTALIETNIAERVGVNGPFISDRQAPLPYGFC
jgi:hypothetical protein